MSDLFAMRRANGDWFVLENYGRTCVPVFHSSQDAMRARVRNFGMLLFEPVALDDRLIKEITSAVSKSDVDFCMVKDPFDSLSRSRRIDPTQLSLLLGRPQFQPLTPSEHESLESGPVASAKRIMD